MPITGSLPSSIHMHARSSLQARDATSQCNELGGRILKNKRETYPHKDMLDTSDAVGQALYTKLRFTDLSVSS